MRSQKSTCTKAIIVLVGLLVVLWGRTAPAQHKVDLTRLNTIPSYCKQQEEWCSAASVQMILEGYPNGVEHPLKQSDIWNKIQSHKQESWPGSDPDGVRGALMELGGDPGVNWVIFKDSSPESLMYSIAYWMTKRRYPTATLGGKENSYEHWMVIRGFETDADPTTTSSVTLNKIYVTSPNKCETGQTSGDDLEVQGEFWYTQAWGNPSGFPASKWNGYLVAVIEPPLKKGVARARRQPTEGRVIPPDDAARRAEKILRELMTDRTGRYQALRGTAPLPPLLVNRQAKGYYLVPLGLRGRVQSAGAIMLNAYNGEFAGVGVLAQPMQYISETQASTIALQFLGPAGKGQNVRSAELLFRFTKETHGWLRPAWVVRTDDFTVYVTQNGKAYRNLTPLGPGT